VTRFDRYMLSQFMVLFGFFALVLVSIFWINKAVRMFDRLIGDGQPAWIFLEFTALTLPGLVMAFALYGVITRYQDAAWLRKVLLGMQYGALALLAAVTPRSLYLKKSRRPLT